MTFISLPTYTLRSISAIVISQRCSLLNLSLTYSDTRSEAYCNYEYNDSMTIMKWVRGSNHRHNIAINAMLDKTFIPIGVSLKFDATYNRDSYLVSQSGVMVNNHSHHASGTLTTSFQKISCCAYQSLLQLNITGNKVVSWSWMFFRPIQPMQLFTSSLQRSWN